MPRFNNICTSCWQQQHPLTWRMIYRELSPKRCHYCGKMNTDGICIREDKQPATDKKGGSDEPPFAVSQKPSPEL